MAEFEDHPSVRNLKQCYYELLDIEMDATEEEIRQAYKYQALRWHPDKNRSDPEAASAMFREVQQAYDVLMDVKKRRWYDKFRDKILQGNEDLIDDKCIDLDEFMSSACYSGFDNEDVANGTDFYSVYRKVFEELMREELPYEDEEDVTPPGFGDGESQYEDVHNFYSFWSSFCTKKTFDHLMKYDILEAPNRRTLRAMEKENVKIRETAKKMRNEEVRKLVGFIRKRDKRVIKRKNELKTINETNRKKTEDNRRKVIQSQRQEQSEQQAESEWTSMKSLERSLHALEKRYDREHAAAAAADSRKKNGQQNGQQEEEDDDVLILSDEEEENGDQENRDQSQDDEDQEPADPGNMFCIACDKRFKSRPAFDNHSRSKKHLQNVNELKKHLLLDESLIS